MASSNRSPSYLAWRDFVRNWTSTTQAGDFARHNAREWSDGNDASHVFDDDQWTDFEEFYRENRDAVIVAKNNLEMQNAFQQGHALPGTRLLRFARVPLGYHLRRIAETGEPDYWNDMRNTLREVLDNPWFATVPAWYLRGKLETLLPKGQSILIYDEFGKPVKKAKTDEQQAADEPVAVIPVPMDLSEFEASSGIHSAA